MIKIHLVLFHNESLVFHNESLIKLLIYAAGLRPVGLLAKLLEGEVALPPVEGCAGGSGGVLLEHRCVYATHLEHATHPASKGLGGNRLVGGLVGEKHPITVSMSSNLETGAGNLFE